MNLINATKMEAGYAPGLDIEGRELLIVAVKGTFTIPEAGQDPELAAVQAPLIYADEFIGEPGFSAPLYESDFAAAKPRCDVLLNGSAYAPGGIPSRRVTVELRVGRMKKRFDVIGDRVWKNGLLGARASRPRPFAVMPISYNNAFGGVDDLDKDPLKHVTHLSNFAGTGFYPRSGKRAIAGKAVPNTEERSHRVKRPTGGYRPMALGAIGRAWLPRCQYAGTYDQSWIDNTFPFLPPDFNPLYNQAAPLDQQIEYLQGGEEIRLIHLMTQSPVSFRLPFVEMPVVLSRKDGDEVEIQATNDTLLIEPDLRRFIRVWRAVFPLKRNLFEIDQVIAGRMPRAWYLARESGKPYFSSIQEFILARAQARAEFNDLEADAEEFPEAEETAELLEDDKPVEETVP